MADIGLTSVVTMLGSSGVLVFFTRSYFFGAIMVGGAIWLFTIWRKRLVERIEEARKEKRGP